MNKEGMAESHLITAIPDSNMKMEKEKIVMGFWGILIITLGSLAIYEDLILKMIRLFQRIGLIDKQYLFSAGNGFEYTYLESARIWALILLIVILLCFTVLYYRKHHEFFWNKIVNP